MDRLVCGDVGFGKTEVALRAAFVAAMAGKQVAVVVPTTLAGAPAFQDLRRTLRRIPGEDAPTVALRGCEGCARDQGGTGNGRRQYRHRHPCAARQRHYLQQSRAGDRRRGAAFRRRAQGAAEGAEGRRACADADGDAHPAHAATGAVGRARSVAHHHAADRPAGGAHLRDAVRSAGDPRGACCASIIAAGRASMSRRASPIFARRRSFSRPRCRR